MNNTKSGDNGGRLIFENATLCSQFLREYTGLEIMKDVKPEDIEDMTERFLPMFTEERDSDVVKRVRLRDNGELFVITLIEHKSSVDYNTVMQVFHYISYIWEEYEKNMESEHKGITKTKDFKYPPILPIVYYEDTAEWTSVTRLSERIYLNDVFGEYLPDYRYILFGLQNHGNSELIDKRDEISFVMLFNKIRSLSDLRNMNLSDEYCQEILAKTPGDVRMVLQRLLQAYLRKINLPESEIHDYTDHILEGNMNCLFENVEKLDIQWERREAKYAKEFYIISLVCKKLRKGKSVSQITDELEEDESTIRAICDVAQNYAPEYDAEQIKNAMYPYQE